MPGAHRRRHRGDDHERQAEVRHKVANLFQLLSTLTRLRMQRAQEAQSRRELGALLEMVSALALTHQRLLSPGGEDFALCLGDMADHWRRRCAGRPIAIELTSEPLVVHESHASALALIANKYIKVKPTASQAGDLPTACTFTGLLGALTKSADAAVPVTDQVRALL